MGIGTTTGGMTSAQRLLLALLVESIFLNYIDRSNLSLAAPIIQKDFALSPGALGSLFSAFFWTYALLQLVGIAGWLADRYPVGLVLAGGLFVWSAATIFTGIFSGLPVLFAARLLVGAGESVAYPCYSRIFASAIPSEHRGVANAFLDAASKLGPALGTLIGGALLATVGWRMFFVVLGAVSLLWLIPWLRWMPHISRTQDAEAGPSTLDILGARSAWGAFLGHFCGNYFWFFLLTWLPTYLVTERAYPMAKMVRVSSIAYFAMAAATMCAGWISDRWIARGGTPTQVRKTVVIFGLTCSTIILPVAVVRDPSTSTLLLLLACMAFGTYTSNHWAITQTLAGPLAAGRWTSLQNGIGNLSGIVAAWLTGVVVERTHSFLLPFAMAAGIAVAGAILWGVVVEEVKPVEWTK
jgi:ACS family D-galactonate transporter-like MFS transporter